MASITVTGSAQAALPYVALGAFVGQPISHISAAGSELAFTGAANGAEVIAALTASAPLSSEAQELVQTALATSGASDAGRAVLSKTAATARALLNIGVRHSRYQQELYASLRSDAVVVSTLARLCTRLSSSTFLASERVTAVDILVASALWDVLTLVFPPSIPSPDAAPVQRWFATVGAHPSLEASAIAVGLLTGGRVRVGGQVDLRPQPVTTGALADASIAKNASHTKAGSQRDGEKAGKEEHTPAAASASSASGASSAASGVAATATQPEANKTLPTLSAEARIELTSTRLREAGIEFTLHRHAAAATVDDLKAALASLPGSKAKNLFVKAKKEKAAGDSRMWLIVADVDTKVDLVDVAKRLGYGKIVIRFAEADALLDNLGTVQGHVSPLALMNDTAMLVNVAIDAKLLQAAAGPVYVHPMTNEASLALAPADLVKFIRSTGHTFTTIDFSTPA